MRASLDQPDPDGVAGLVVVAHAPLEGPAVVGPLLQVPKKVGHRQGSPVRVELGLDAPLLGVDAHRMPSDDRGRLGS